MLLKYIFKDLFKHISETTVGCVSHSRKVKLSKYLNTFELKKIYNDFFTRTAIIWNIFPFAVFPQGFNIQFLKINVYYFLMTHRSSAHRSTLRRNP